MERNCSNLALGNVVLIVEDEPVLSMAAGDFFVDAGFEVLEAKSCDEAAAMMAERKDIVFVFTDVQTPGAIDGVGLAIIIETRWPHVRTVVTSGAQQPSHRPLPPSAVFMAKPYDLPAIAKLLEAV